METEAKGVKCAYCGHEIEDTDPYEWVPDQPFCSGYCWKMFIRKIEGR